LKYLVIISDFSFFDIKADKFRLILKTKYDIFLNRNKKL